VAAFVKLLKRICVTKSWGALWNWIDAAYICRIFPTLRSPLSVTPDVGRPSAAMGENISKQKSLNLKNKDFLSVDSLSLPSV
jgi:hypothetical protein